MPRTNIVNFTELEMRLREAVAEVVATTAVDAEELAVREAPVRKIFTGQKRSVRALTYREFRAEATARKRIGLPSTYREMTGPGQKTFRGPLMTERERRFGPYRRMAVPTNPFLRSFSHRPHQPDPSFREVDVKTRQLIREKQLQQGTGRRVSARGRYEVEHGGELDRRSAVEGRLAPRADVSVPAAGPYGGYTATQVGGRLKRSIYLGRQEYNSGRFVQRVHSPVYYSKYVEFGTRHAAAQPYMRPALAKVRERYRQRMEQNIRIVLKRKLVQLGAPVPAGAEAGEISSQTAAEPTKLLGIGERSGGE